MSLESGPGADHEREPTALVRTASTPPEHYSKYTVPFLSEVKLAIDKCEHDHETCNIDRHLQSTLKNFKVIDCCTREVVEAQPGCIYVALSYVWGTTVHSSSLKDKLPQTIEDSLQVVLLLGYRYLWVDRYCIAQNKYDKHHQIQQMGAIYAGTHLTIIAYSGKDPTAGLPGMSRDFDRTSQERGAHLQSVWRLRGWTLQEAFLSRRRLLFTTIGLAYDCKREFITEFGGDRAFFAFIDGRLSRNRPRDVKDALRVFFNLMEGYSCRHLTLQSDALNAIVGVLNTLSTPQAPISHLWAIPYVLERRGGESIAIFDLCWLSLRLGTRRFGFPSWSPLGWANTPIYSSGFNSHNFSSSPDFDLEVQLGNGFRHINLIVPDTTDAQCCTQGSQEIRITAYSVQSSFISRINPNEGVDMFSRHTMLLNTGTFSFRVEQRWTDGDFIAKPDKFVVCVFHSAACASGLLLKQSGEYFERVGAFLVDQDGQLMLKDRIENVIDRTPLGSPGESTKSIRRRTFLLR